MEDLVKQEKLNQKAKSEEYIKANKVQRCLCFVCVEKIKNYIMCNSNKRLKKRCFAICVGSFKKKDLSSHYIKNSTYSKCKKLKENKKEIQSDFLI